MSLLYANNVTIVLKSDDRFMNFQQDFTKNTRTFCSAGIFSIQRQKNVGVKQQSCPRKDGKS